MNIKTLLSALLILLFNFSNVFGQYEITIQAFVIDQNTKFPVSYANIGFADKSIGTVTNRSGRFYLQYDESKIKENDKFLISGMGYEPLTLSQKQLFDLLKNNNTISLKPSISDVRKEEQSVKRVKTDVIGYTDYQSNLLAYWKDKKALGGEIATLIKVKKENAKLLNLKFNISENTADSLKVRVNIYNKQGKKPGNNLLSKNIYHTISRKRGEEVIDLSDYDIKVNEDFIASIELIKVYGDDMRFAVNVGKGGRSFLKHVSHDAWKEHKGAGIAFKLETLTSVAFPESENNKVPEHIVMYWDTSLSMQDRDINREITFLRTYFSAIKNVTVDVTSFSDTIKSTKRFEIVNGNSDALIAMLAGLKYDGGSDFSHFFEEADKPDQYFVFTDGLNTYGDYRQMYGTPIYCISSSQKTNDLELQQSGDYLNLSKLSVNTALSYILHGLDENISQQTITEVKKGIQGKVIANNKPVQGCKVIIKGTLVEAITDENGDFSIDVGVDQVLSFQHFSMKNKEIIYDGEKILQIELKPKYQELSEVELSQKKKQSKEIINLGNRKIDKRKLGFATYSIERKNFPPGSQSIFDLLRSRFPGVQVFMQENGEMAVTVRARSSVSLRNDAAWVVDGILQARMPVNLQAPEIESITLIPGLAGAVRYGSQARNGVFIVETRLAAAIENDRLRRDTLLVKGNDYKESTLLLDSNQNRPKYLSALYNSSNYNEALEVYYQLRKSHKYEVPFYVYSSEYFKRWDLNFSEQVISNLAEIGNNNYGVLKTLAFLLEEKGNTQKAVTVYENIFDIKPDYAQSYLDLGRIYKENEQYAKSFEMYKKVLMKYEDLNDFVEVRKQAESELRHLLNNHRSQISYKDIPKSFLNVKSVPVRIVFDWNDPQAEFEFQFVNPKKKYEKWAHRFDQNRELLIDEVKYGMTSKEFIVDKSMPGEWIINVQSHGKVSKLNPTFMKYTIYNDYGLPSETKTVKFIKLYNYEEKVMLDKFSI